MNNVFALAGVVIKELYRRKDFYVLFVLTALLTLILGSANIFNDEQIVRYLKEICLLLIWVCSLVIAITTAARQIPAERESRTIFPLLAKPVTRAQLIGGKFVGCWLACGISLLLFYFFYGVIIGSREHALAFTPYFQAVWLHWICLGIVTAMVLLGSVVFTAPSSNATICFIVIIGLLFAGQYLNRIAAGIGGVEGAITYALYYFIPHLEFFDIRKIIVHNHAPVTALAVEGATLYGALYSVFLLALAWGIFRRKALTV
ncbi:MAG TPA: ABC transporter permease subunit [Verrucomicrobiae bacterium]|jgi:ABC-type transport system involved in multi-copper enzyme maturation permease subunit|nr:ABC transporter permease subunit [Verrucomicrobiae bacterium]